MISRSGLITGRSRNRLTIAVALAGAVAAWPAQAAELGGDDVSVTIDTTISHGLTMRVEGHDDDLAADLNANDGDLNYDHGLASSVTKITSEVEADLGYVGLFARVSGFYDQINENEDRERTELSNDAKEEVGKDARILDLYVDTSLEAGDALIDLRLGNQVLNWGESTFIQNGVNVINPFDVSRLRLPGSELREALLPVPIASVSVAPNDNLSLEGFYQFAWEETEIDPVGSYFSVNDYVGAGGTRAIIDLGGTPSTDLGSDLGPITPLVNADLAPLRMVGVMPLQMADPDFLTVSRASDIEPDDAGQFGLATRYLSESLHDTEFGLFFVNYHSRLPLVSARHGNTAAFQGALGAAERIANPAGMTFQAISQGVQSAVTQQVTAAVTAQVEAAVQAGALPAAQAPAVIMQQVAAGVAAQAPAIRQAVTEQVGNVAGAVAINHYAKSARYFVEYPERLSVFGASFNTELGRTGWALQGEVSFRPDAPLQLDDEYLFEQGLAPLISALGCGGNQACLGSAFASLPSGQKLQGYIERDVTQVQATATKAFGPTRLGNDSGIFLTEAAMMFVHDMPESAVMPLEATGDDPADAFSWGYRLAARLDYANAIGPATLSPFLQFQHDVTGSSPSPSGPFAQGRTALTVGLNVEYLQRWQGSLSYTRLDGQNNPLRDRDFVSLNVKYSF